MIQFRGNDFVIIDYECSLFSQTGDTVQLQNDVGITEHGYEQFLDICFCYQLFKTFAVP